MLKNIWLFIVIAFWVLVVEPDAGVWLIVSIIIAVLGSMVGLGYWIGS